MADEAPPAPEEPPAPKTRPLTEGILPTSLPDLPKTADIALAGLGLFGTIALLGFLQDQTGLQLFVPAMMASGIIFFAGPAPPDPRGFISGTLCSATLSAFLLYTLDEVLPPVAADGASAGLLLVWYRTVGAIFPPAAVLAGTLTTTAASKAAQLAPDVALAKGASFVVFPWLAGHGTLWTAALGLSSLRQFARVKLTEGELAATLGGLSDEKLFAIFDRFDTDDSGALDPDELKIALRVALGDDLSIEDCVRIVSEADRDGNGVVDFQEFCFVCRGQI